MPLTRVLTPSRNHEKREYKRMIPAMIAVNTIKPEATWSAVNDVARSALATTAILVAAVYVTIAPAMAVTAAAIARKTPG